MLLFNPYRQSSLRDGGVSILIWIVCGVRKKRISHNMMDMKIINLQKTEFKDTLNIKV